jgi:hypothetical protein
MQELQQRFQRCRSAERRPRRMAAPVPKPVYFGGKSSTAPVVWNYFGGVRYFVEPAAHSADDSPRPKNFCVPRGAIGYDPCLS